MTTLLLLTVLTSAPDAPPAAALAAPVRDAVVAAVAARLGVGAEVVVTAVDAVSPLGGEVADAVLLPGAVIGGPVHLVLRGRRDGAGATLVPVGRVTVRVAVTVPHQHTTRPLARGSRMTDADLADVRHTLARGALRPLPARDALVDGRVIRDLPADACLTTQVVLPMPAVVAGRAVTAVVREGRVEVRATLVAVDSGAVGEMVRVSHPDSRRAVRARVTGRAEVEISHEP